MVSLFLYNFEFFYFYADILYDGIDVANAIKRITDSRLLQVISNHDKFCKSLISNRDKAKQKRFGDILELVCYPLPMKTRGTFQYDGSPAGRDSHVFCSSSLGSLPKSKRRWTWGEMDWEGHDQQEWSSGFLAPNLDATVTCGVDAGHRIARSERN